MGNGERFQTEGNGERRVVYCLIPFELADKLHEPLRDHFRDDRGVEVIVEQRSRDRRRGAERRQESIRADELEGERRRITAAAGRRVGERRSAQQPTESPVALPRRLRRYADRIAFVERLAPSSEQVEDVDTARLVARIQAGDAGAFSELYLRFFDRIYAYLRMTLRNAHDAEDLTQQVFLKLVEALPRYERRRQPFRAWLFTIVRNEAVSHLRRHSRVSVTDREEIDRRRAEQGLLSEQADLPALGWISDRDLLLFVERLPDPQRQVIGLRYLLDLSYREIATIVGRTPEDVKVMHHRGMLFLRQRLSAVGRGSRGKRPIRSSRRFKQAEVLRHRRFALMR